MTGGFLGDIFTTLAFSGALVAFVAFLFAEFRQGEDQKSWEQLGVGGFLVHAISVLGIIGTLFYLIYTHQYQYHYVWSHSSNELPVYYMISCFWEGQEGSFLLWSFWHVVLGLILVFRKSEWRNLVMAIIASVNLILSTMILGIYVPENWVWAIYILLGLTALGLTLRPYLVREASSGKQSLLIPAVGLLGLTSLMVLLRGQAGFLANWSWAQLFSGLDGFSFGLFVVFWFGLVALILREAVRPNFRDPWFLAGGILMAMTGLIIAGFEPVAWKVGSTPFISLKDAMPNAEVFATDPDFVPANGTGLNPLLQNYWMVIHPPTLFLGFAATVVPFAFVVAGLIKGEYKKWIKPALPWNTFAAMILGIGIIMGGYWAYETLNFGGYWNWDPVENSSFVPWLVAVASLHGMLIYQRSKAYLGLTMVMIISTFLLVLYSTFLTRSGILGDTSVHTFTDLGLSGQLILLVAVYTVAVVVLLAARWKKIPSRSDESKVWSAEFMLFLGVLVFLFSAAEILFSTSLPVINKIFGTSVAPPANIQLFYYQWNVWFAIGFGILSGMGQFLWWKIKRKKSIAEALYRPFLIAILAGSAVLVALALNEKQFAYDGTFREMIEPGAAGSSFLAKAWAWVQYGFLASADELLLFSSLFVVLANGDVLISMLRKNRKGLKVMGGTVVHIGFGLMLLGMLFSSGYDEVISKNLRPAELAAFPEDERVDNIALPKGQARPIPGYNVTFVGKKEAQPPLRDLEIIERNQVAFKLRFKDATGDRFGIVLPLQPFWAEGRQHSNSESGGQKIADTGEPTSSQGDGEIDLVYVKDFLERNLQYLKPGHINNRTLYGVSFASLDNPEKQFLLYPEAEVNEEMGSIIAHPARKVFWNRDIYVHVSSVPAPDDSEPEFDYHDLTLKIGQQTTIGETQILLAGVRDFSSRPEMKNYAVAAAAQLLVITRGDTFQAEPVYVIDPEGKPGMVEANLPEAHMDFAFVSIDPATGQMQFQVQRQVNAQSDYVIIKAISKPFINLLWLGTFILVAGFLISIYRRINEQRRT